MSGRKTAKLDPTCFCSFLLGELGKFNIKGVDRTSSGMIDTIVDDSDFSAFSLGEGEGIITEFKPEIRELESEQELKDIDEERVADSPWWHLAPNLNQDTYDLALSSRKHGSVYEAFQNLKNKIPKEDFNPHLIYPKGGEDEDKEGLECVVLNIRPC